MAKFTEDGLSGLVGSVVIYNVKGKKYLRARPAKRKKKRGQKPLEHQRVFGLVSKYGSRMAQVLRKELHFPFGRETFYTLRGWMRDMYSANAGLPSWELVARNNGMCQLNPDADLRDLLEAQLTVTAKRNGIIEVSIPSLNPIRQLKVPPRTEKINLKVMAVTSGFDVAKSITGFASIDHTINYSNSEIILPAFSLDTHAKTGDIAIVVVALEFETTADTPYKKDVKWLPAGVVGMGRV